MKKIFTVGYEGKNINEFIAKLKGSGVKNLIDVRIYAGSRKRDFSKNILAAHLANVGISYSHHKELGTPKYLMDVMKTEGHYEMEAYDKYISERPEIIQDFVDKTNYKNICLMCYEKNPMDCHRSVVASKLSILTKGVVSHLE